MRYKLYATTEDYEDRLVYEDDDFIKVAHKCYHVMNILSIH